MTAALLGLALAIAALWTWLALRLLAGRDRQRLLGPDDRPAPADPPAIHAVVPAHNEQEHVADTVRDLLAQSIPGLAITVVDDQSTDATAAVLEDLIARLDPTERARVHLIRGADRPEGWVGKTWAVEQGVRTTAAPWLLFVDGDMRLHPQAVAIALRIASEREADLVSLLPRTVCRSFWQGTMATAVWFVVAQVHSLNRVNDPGSTEALAAGGFILVNRPAYERAGGHAGVRREIVDDIRLARNVKRAGGRLSVHPAGDLAWTHMYGGFADIWRGLRKNCYAGMDYMPHKFVTGALGALLIAWVPWIALAAGLAGGAWGLTLAGLWGVLAQAAAALPMIVFLALPIPFVLSLPIGLTTYVGIGAASVWHHTRGRVIWKDRLIPTSLVDPARAVGEGVEP